MLANSLASIRQHQTLKSRGHGSKMDLDEHVRIGRNEYFMYFASVSIVNGSGKWEDGVTSCAVSQ